MYAPHPTTTQTTALGLQDISGVLLCILTGHTAAAASTAGLIQPDSLQMTVTSWYFPNTFHKMTLSKWNNTS